MKRVFTLLDHMSDLWMVGATVCFAGALALFFGGLAGGLFAGVAQLIFGLSNDSIKVVWEVSAIVWFPIPLGLFIATARSWRVTPMHERDRETVAADEMRS